MYKFNFRKFTLLLLILLLFSSLFNLVSGEPITERALNRVFYIYNAPNHRLVLLSPTSDNHVKVYSLDQRLVTELTLEANKPEAINIEKYLKIISEEPIMVYSLPLEGGRAFATYFPSETGSFHGKKFYLFTPTPEVRIYSLETGVVSIYNETGLITLIPVVEDSYTHYILPDWDPDTYLEKMWIFESTAEIMIYGAGGGWPWYTAPAADSEGIVGNIHYAHSLAGGHYGSLLIIAYAAGEARIINLTNPSQILTIEFEKPGEYYFSAYPGTPFKLESDMPVLLQAGFTDHINMFNGYTGMHYAGGWRNEEGEVEYWFYVNRHGPAVVFAPQDVEIEVNGSSHELKADTWIELKGPAIWHVVSPIPLVVQLQPLDGYAVAPPDLPPTEPGISIETGIDLTIPILVVVVIVFLILLFLLRSRRRKANSSENI